MIRTLLIVAICLVLSIPFGLAMGLTQRAGREKIRHLRLRWVLRWLDTCTLPEAALIQTEAQKRIEKLTNRAAWLKRWI